MLPEVSPANVECCAAAALVSKWFSKNSWHTQAGMPARCLTTTAKRNPQPSRPLTDSLCAPDNHTPTTPPVQSHHTHTIAKMVGVSVRDVPADKFIEAYAAFLKRQGKLPIPGP